MEPMEVYKWSVCNGSKASKPLDRFISCEKYEDKLNNNWKNILSENYEDQLVIGNFIEKKT